MKRLIFLALLGVATVAGFSLTTSPTSMKVNKGSKLSLTCVASETAQYTWYKQNTIPNMVMDELYTGADVNSNVITVDSTTVSHAGFYQCKAVSGDMTVYSNVASVAVYYYPEIDLTTKTVNINDAQSAVRTGLDCEISGNFNPDYTIEWYKDGEVVSDTNAFVVHSTSSIKVDSISDLTVKPNTLVLFNIKKRLEGTYQCRVTATVTDGVVIQTAYEYNVNVNSEFGEIDYVSSSLAVTSAQVTSGETATLCCGTIGYSDGAVPVYTWYNSAQEEITEGLTDSKRTLKVTASGSYTCKACTGEACTSGVATASVSQADTPVQFTQEPTNYYLYEDGVSEGALSLTCKTTLGDGNWMKNGKALSFPIENPSSSDSGIYQCYGSNSDSWISRTTQIIVTDALSVTLSVPEEIDEDSTDNVVTCIATGYPTPSVNIYKENYEGENESIATCYDQAADVTGCIRKNANTYSVTIDKTNVESSGKYFCLATHSYQSKDGSNLNQNEIASGSLSVIRAVRVEEFATASTALEYGQMVEFTCKVSGGRAPYKVEMKRGDLIILTWSSNVNSGDFKGNGTCTGAYEKTCKGTINVVYGHEGTATCTGYNTVKEDKTMTDSTSMDLTVTRSTFVEITGDFFPIRGDAMTLTCVQHEKPLNFNKDAAVTWFRDGEAVTPDSQTATEHPTLFKGTVEAVFNGVSSEHEGKYKCLSAGVTSAEVDVYVGSDTGEAPYNVKMTIPNGVVGEEMGLICEARGYPPPTLTWTIYTDKTVANTTTVTKEKFKTTSHLVWTPTEKVTMDVKCTATNGNGTATATAVMEVITEADAEAQRLKDSEIAAIIAASIIAGIILLICVIFIVICLCKNYRERKHDGDADVLDGSDPNAKAENPYASVFSIKRNKLKGLMRNPFALPDKKEEEPDIPAKKKSHYSEIVGEVQNKDPDDPDPDKVIFNPSVKGGDPTKPPLASEGSVTRTTRTTSSSTSSSSSSDSSSDKTPSQRV